MDTHWAWHMGIGMGHGHKHGNKQRHVGARAWESPFAETRTAIGISGIGAGRGGIGNQGLGV
jgi:hypothetical protein